MLYSAGFIWRLGHVLQLHMHSFAEGPLLLPA